VRYGDIPDDHYSDRVQASRLAEKLQDVVVVASSNQQAAMSVASKLQEQMDIKGDPIWVVLKGCSFEPSLRSIEPPAPSVVKVVPPSLGQSRQRIPTRPPQPTMAN
jgi:hypothetical protein